VAVWVLDEALNTISEVVAAEVAICAMVMAVGGSGHEMRGCRACRGAVGQFDSICHYFSAAAYGLERGRAGDLVVINRHINSDLVVRLGDSGEMGDRRTSWEEQDNVGGLLNC
jgi:hypothetical protein